jgi:hypothetical protein
MKELFRAKPEWLMDGRRVGGVLSRRYLRTTDDFQKIGKEYLWVYVGSSINSQPLVTLPNMRDDI